MSRTKRILVTALSAEGKPLGLFHGRLSNASWRMLGQAPRVGHFGPSHTSQGPMTCAKYGDGWAIRLRPGQAPPAQMTPLPAPEVAA